MHLVLDFELLLNREHPVNYLFCHVSFVISNKDDSGSLLQRVCPNFPCYRVATAYVRVVFWHNSEGAILSDYSHEVSAGTVILDKYPLEVGLDLEMLYDLGSTANRQCHRSHAEDRVTVAH